MRIRHIAFGAIPLLLSVACASTSDVQRQSLQVADLQDQIADLKRQVSSKEEVARLNERIAQQTESLLKSNAELSVKLGDMEDRLQNTQGGIEQTNYRIDRLVQQIAQNQRDIDQLKLLLRAANPGAGAAPSPDATATPGVPQGGIQDEVTVQPPARSVADDPIELYQTAYRDYQRGNFDLAMQGFQEFLEKFPQSDLADNAAYWIGESLFSQKKYEQAIEQFDAVVNRYTQSDKVPGALLKKGYAYIELGQKAQGAVQLQYVIHEHPRAPEASLARQKLKAMGIDTN